MIASQQALANFFASVKFQDPELAEFMAPHIEIVSIWGLGADKSGGQDSADRLREGTRQFLPEVFSRVLNATLDEMGYS